jgi:hypothetical protein
MKKAIWVLNINSYRPDVCLHTYPTIKEYAKKIGADFNVIDQRMFSHKPITMEKMQIFELGKDYDINILVDADVLISPKLEDITKIASNNPGVVSVMQAFSIPRYFPYHFMFDRLPLVTDSDGNHIKVGPSANFVVTTKWSHYLWEPNVEVPNLYDPFRIDEYIMSYNLAKYGLLLDVFGNPIHPHIHHLAVTSKPSDGDMEDLLNKKKEWGI